MNMIIIIEPVLLKVPLRRPMVVQTLYLLVSYNNITLSCILSDVLYFIKMLYLKLYIRSLTLLSSILWSTARLTARRKNDRISSRLKGDIPSQYKKVSIFGNITKA